MALEGQTCAICLRSVLEGKVLVNGCIGRGKRNGEIKLSAELRVIFGIGLHSPTHYSKESPFIILDPLPLLPMFICILDSPQKHYCEGLNRRHTEFQ